MHPILDTLNGTPHEWLKKLLYTFNEGNIGKFEALAPLFPREVSSSYNVAVDILPYLLFASQFYKRITPSCARRSA